jgi:hypothetical protein
LGPQLSGRLDLGVLGVEFLRFESAGGFAERRSFFSSVGFVLRAAFVVHCRPELTVVSL